MKRLIPFVLVLLPAWALAQPAPTGSAGSAAPPAGSAAPTAGSADPSAAGSAAITDTPTAPTGGPTPVADPKALRRVCTDAMNADPTFAAAIVQIADKDAAEKRLQLDAAQHQTAATAIEKNERHVLLAYASMWIVAALFVLFLWRRQQALKLEIAHLRRDLDVATKEGK